MIDPATAVAIAEALGSLVEKGIEIVKAAHGGTITAADAQAMLTDALTGPTGLHATLEARKTKALADLAARFPGQ